MNGAFRVIETTFFFLRTILKKTNSWKKCTVSQTVHFFAPQTVHLALPRTPFYFLHQRKLIFLWQTILDKRSIMEVL